MQPVENHFDLYFDTLHHFRKQGFSYKIGITPPDFHQAITHFRKLSMKALNAGKSSPSRIYAREKKKVYELIKNSHDYVKCIDYFIETSREIVILSIVSTFDGASPRIVPACKEFARKYNPCFRLLIVDVDDAMEWTKRHKLRILPFTFFFYNNQLVGFLAGRFTFQQLERYTDSIYESADVQPCEVRQEMA
jgi:hypothetical protein